MRDGACIVNQEVDRPARVREFRHVLGFTEIERVHGDFRAVLVGEFLLRGFKTLRVAGGQVQYAAFGGQ